MMRCLLATSLLGAAAFLAWVSPATPAARRAIQEDAPHAASRPAAKLPSLPRGGPPARTRHAQRPPEPRHNRSPESLLAALRAGDPGEKERAFRTVLPDLLAEDPARAAKLAEQLEPWAWRAETLREVARAWGARHPAAACAWAVSLPEEAERHRTLRDIFHSVARTDPGHALQLAQQHGQEHDEVLLGNLLPLWAARDWSAAESWVEQSLDAASRERAYSRLALAHARTRPAAAATLVAERMGPGAEQEEAAIAVLHQWLRHDPGAAQEWILQFPAGALRERAEQEFAALDRYRTPLAAE